MIEPANEDLRVHLDYLVAVHPEWPRDIIAECYDALAADDFERMDRALARLDRYTEIA